MNIRELTQSSDVTLKATLAIVLILLAIFGRMVPHPANFAPIAAVAIFGGAILPRKWALSLPLAAMVISDLIIGLHPLILFTWGSFALIALASNKFIKKVQPLTVVTASLSASVFFYIVTNFGVWLQGQLYPLTLSGLGQSYFNAIPFFRNTVLGDLVFSVILFGAYAFVCSYALPRAKSPVAAKVSEV
jgi:hypothetical protein